MPPPAGRADHRSKRRIIAAGLVLLVVASVAATWFASGRIRSPAEVAARTLAPEPSPILVPVERRVVASEIVTRGTARFGSPQTLFLVPSDLASASRYVDVVPTLGTELADGQVMMVISGRPVIVLEGTQPAHRDLGPGTTGADVEQLEQALDRLGFGPGAVDGIYDDSTAAAVARWYRALGFEPVAATASQQQEVRTLEIELAAAQEHEVGAADSVAAAEAELIAARDAHQAAMAAAVDASALASTERARAEAALAAAKADADAAALAAAQAWIRLPPEWASEEESQAALFELESLRVAARGARAAVELVRVEGEAAVAEADAAAARAPLAVETARAAVAAAVQRVALARQATVLADAPSAQLTERLTEARMRSGVQVPAGEVVFVPTMPVRVAAVLAERGSPIEGPLVQVTDAVLAVDGTLALDQVQLVEPGMTVELSEPDLGIAAVGTVSFVADGPGTRGADGFHVYFETLVTESDAPIANIAGASVRLTIPVKSSGGPVLAVPVSALTLAADGSSQLVVDRSGVLETVTVEPGLSAAGYVELREAADVHEGELVVVGFEAATAPGS